MRSKICILLISIFVAGCFPLRKSVDSPELAENEQIIDSLCAEQFSFQSIYMNKIKATLHLDGERYDARISLYYIPDSIIFLTAANTGFEILRAAVTSDSIILINRIDKLVYVYKEKELGYAPPVRFEDLEYLLNRSKMCNGLNRKEKEKRDLTLDFSSQDIKKQISYSGKALKINGFEFFHKKTGEYIVGEANSDTLSVFSNYIVKDVEIEAVAGELTMDKEMQVDLSFNRNKYTILEN